MYPDELDELVAFVVEQAGRVENLSKEGVQSGAVSRFDLRRDGSVAVGRGFAARFSWVRGSGFPNAVLALRRLRLFDEAPFVVVAVRPSGATALLANSTLLKRVSHSAHLLSETLLRGSFLGSDIQRSLHGIQNVPPNFRTLFEIHSRTPWEENVRRLVESSSLRVPRARGEFGVGLISTWVETAIEVLTTDAYIDLGRDLRTAVEASRDRILEAARNPNSNIRGRLIEREVVGTADTHAAFDLERRLSVGIRVIVDVKSKLLGRRSNPKGWNVEKLLDELARGSTAAAYFFVLVDLAGSEVKGALVSILDRRIVEATRVQQHWSRSGSRGTTQLQGDLSFLSDPQFVEEIDPAQATEFLNVLVAGP